MKVQPTLAGGLQLHADEPDDWRLLKGITIDAASCDDDLAQRLARQIDQEALDDWQEFVKPDLEDGFSSALQYVSTAVAAAELEAGGGPGPLWITRDDGFQWYSALNQARLALEERYHFGQTERLDPRQLKTRARAAFLRSQLYCAIQSLLLEHVLN